jgi:Kdo2-lipid IVA lauroyltransferase/acyltransferase
LPLAGKSPIVGAVDSVLDAPLPPHWGILQRLKNHLIYVVVRVAYVVIGLVPFLLSRLLALALGHLAAWVDVKDRRRAEAHLARAMPETTAAQRHEIAHRMFVHFAVSAIELIHTERFLMGKHAIPFPEAARAALTAARQEGHGIVLVGGHIGNWELCGQVIAQAGFKITSIAKPVYDPRLTRFINGLRTAYGHRILWRGDAHVAKEILRVFKENGILGILIDQDTKVQGVFAPFFGIPAHTPSAAASFAIRAEAPVFVTYAHRVGDVHTLHFDRCPYTVTGDHHADVLALTAELNRRLEAAIRLRPEQWVWLHQRWKKQPVDSAAIALNNQGRVAPSHPGSPTS